MAAITEQSPHEEAKDDTRTFNVLMQIRATRMSWLGHILRLPDTRMIKQAVKQQYAMRSEGDILMDAPGTESWEELCEIAKKRTEWKAMVNALKVQVFSGWCKRKRRERRGRMMR